MTALSLSSSYYYYPQYRWAGRFTGLLPRYLVDRSARVVDAPCGDGVISYWLLKSGKISNPFELYDRSPELIRKASRLTGQAGQPIKAEACDIFDIESAERRDDLWLVVNSLYLLPDVDRLVTKMRPRFRTIAGVFPYLDRDNYRAYLERSDRVENVSGMSDLETVSFFADHGYRLDHREDAAFLPQYRLNFRGARKILNLLDPLFAGGQGSYWIGLFVRESG